MQVICEASQCTHIPVRVVAMQCLVRIMSLYYQFMEQYMGLALFSVGHLHLLNYLYLSVILPFVKTRLVLLINFFI